MWRTTDNLYKLECPKQLDPLSKCCQPQKAKPDALKSHMTEATLKVTVIFNRTRVLVAMDEALAVLPTARYVLFFLALVLEFI